MTNFVFHQVDVFTGVALRGNPLAVVVAADGVSEAQMAAFARWTNLSETTFLLRPTVDGADYRVRIFTPFRELPFAGHPTLGSCHVWLTTGGTPQREGEIVQQCAAGLIRIRRRGERLAERLAFAAPPCLRSGALEPELLAQITRALSLVPTDILAHQWVDNGPGWSAIRLASAEAVLALHPDWPALAGVKLGVVGPHAAGHETQFEVRALIGEGAGYEDPVTGSLNASLAQWLIASGVAPATYTASQGTALGRAGRVFVEHVGTDLWVGGQTTPCIQGTLRL